MTAASTIVHDLGQAQVHAEGDCSLQEGGPDDGASFGGTATAFTVPAPQPWISADSSGVKFTEEGLYVVTAYVTVEHIDQDTQPRLGESQIDLSGGGDILMKPFFRIGSNSQSFSFTDSITATVVDGGAGTNVVDVDEALGLYISWTEPVRPRPSTPLKVKANLYVSRLA
jgi:hypothetical protein